MGSHKLASRATLRHQLRHLQTERDDLAQRLATVTRDFDVAAVELSGAIADRRAAEARNKRLDAQLSEAVAEIHRLQAQLAERDAVTVPPMYPDTSNPTDVATHPIPLAHAQDWPTLGLRLAPPKGVTR
ncbi:hypothetical protein [Streptomyces sp. B15]|uniref:hypothetical protein n=1 Tax=Streptomyces sp. B15 TaxID=1537797 RepID=UPI001B374EA6|nr:hypothetical protein [Streptomyces sp. B15]MBQ1122601.1 hypothetical protein [Streptomyces sp. B15]